MSGRALFVHMGAALATIMVGNVMRHIVPGQRRVRAAAAAGATQPAGAVQLGRQRASHNTIVSVAVLFFMISNHFPGVYGSGFRWLLVPGFVVAGWMAAKGVSLGAASSRAGKASATP